jgi:hypothetical protein
MTVVAMWVLNGSGSHWGVGSVGSGDAVCGVGPIAAVVELTLFIIAGCVFCLSKDETYLW